MHSPRTQRLENAAELLMKEATSRISSFIEAGHEFKACLMRTGLNYINHAQKPDQASLKVEEK